MIKAICFDLDGVYFTEKGKVSFQNALTSEFDIPADKAKDIMQKSPEMAKLVRGQISNEEFWNWFRTETGVKLSDKELTERWARDYEVDVNVRAAVLAAKEKGFTTCVCTNNNGIRLPKLIEKFDLDKVFDVIVSSHEVGECKPDIKIFEALVKDAGVRPAELVYADDNLERLKGAQELGINTFIFTTFENYLEDLKKLDIDLSPKNEINKFHK